MRLALLSRIASTLNVSVDWEKTGGLSRCGGVEDEPGWGGVGGVLTWPPWRVLSVHFIEQWRCVSSDGHGRALDHGTGRWPRGHPLHLLASLCFFLLQPLLSHFAPVHCRRVAATGPAGRREEAAL